MQSTVNQRLKILIEKLGLNANSFSKEIGLTSNSVVFNILNGRNKPSYELLKKISDRFPTVDTRWLISGETTENEIDNALNDIQATYSKMLSNESNDKKENCLAEKKEIELLYKVITAKDELIKMAEDLIKSTKDHLNDNNELFKETLNITKNSLQDKDKIINLLENKA